MDNFKTPSAGVLLASGMLAGVLAYVLSRRSQKEEVIPTSREAIVARARDLGQGEITRIGKEYLSERVVPEMKPIMLEVLKDFEEYVDRYFDRAEKAIKSM